MLYTLYIFFFLFLIFLLPNKLFDFDITSVDKVIVCLCPAVLNTATSELLITVTLLFLVSCKILSSEHRVEIDISIPGYRKYYFSVI